MNRAGMTMIIYAALDCNAALIYGVGTGVEGVAIPTLVSRAVGAFCILWLLRNTHLQIHLLHGAWKPDFAMMRNILHIGVPSGLENSLFQLGRVLVVQVIAQFGTIQTAANAVANTMDTIGCLPGQTMNLAIITVVGQCIGARDIRQARHYTRKLLLWTYAATALVNAPLLLLLQWALPIFDASREALSLATTLIVIHNGSAMILWPLAFTLPNALRAANDVRYTMVVALVSMAVFRIALSYVIGLGLGMGAVGVWIAMVADWICRVILYVARYRGHRWEQLALSSAG